jgi:hypothetical protein
VHTLEDPTRSVRVELGELAAGRGVPGDVVLKLDVRPKGEAPARDRREGVRKPDGDSRVLKTAVPEQGREPWRRG